MVVTRSKQKECNTCTTPIELGTGAYAKTNDEANRDKTETPSPMVEGAAIGNYTTLSGGTKVIERNASGKIIDHKKQSAKEACTVAEGNEVMAACSSVGGVCAKNLAKDGYAYENTNDEANRDKTNIESHGRRGGYRQLHIY